MVKYWQFHFTQPNTLGYLKNFIFSVFAISLSLASELSLTLQDPFIHFLNKYLLDMSYMPGIILEAEKRARTKLHMAPAFTQPPV